MKKNRYEHLNNAEFRKVFDWENKMFEKSLPERAFTNAFTGGFLMNIQKILVMGFKTPDIIKKYFRF